MPTTVILLFNNNNYNNLLLLKITLTSSMQLQQHSNTPRTRRKSTLNQVRPQTSSALPLPAAAGGQQRHKIGELLHSHVHQMSSSLLPRKFVSNLFRRQFLTLFNFLPHHLHLHLLLLFFLEFKQMTYQNFLICPSTQSRKSETECLALLFSGYRMKPLLWFLLMRIITITRLLLADTSHKCKKRSVK